MSAEKSSSKTDTLVKVVLVFFISLLSFSVGTFVGKQVSDSDHRRMALEGEYKGERNVASTKEDGAEGAGGKISEKEVENLTEEFVNKEKPGTEQASNEEEGATEGKGDIEKTEAKDEKADANGYKSYKREKVADKKSPVAAKPAKLAEAAVEKPAKASKAAKAEKVAKVEESEESGGGTSGGVEKVAADRKPSSTLPSVASSAVGKYTVQVGSFAEEKEAKSHAAELKGKGWNAFYFAAAIEGRTWYRVSVGLFNNMGSANKFRAEFMKDSGTKAAIVQKIVQ